jgi:hypothetical protein
MTAVFENVKNYATQLGIFWSSFNGLEMMLRIYLARKSGVGTKALITYINSNAGDVLPECPITDWKTFKMLCAEYNKDKVSADKIDFSEVNFLRDAMAHGRVTGDSAGNMIVVKYTKPVGTKVTVEFKRILTESYLNEMVEFMNGATHKVSSFIAPYMKE